MIKLYNSLSRKKEPLPQPDPKKKLCLFVCGPTVYDNPHIGNARTFMVFDIIVRYLRSRGIKIFYLQNITDIDDKIIRRAEEEKIDWKTISRRYEKIFLADMKRLGIDSVDKYARATDFIPQIVDQVKRLTLKKHAYLIPGDGYYFDLKTFPEYGKLAGRTIEQAEDATSRIDTSDKKRNKGDFALWKLSRDDEPGWKTKLGFGRPGWHIEDTAISEHFFGPQYELHGGALDLKFPHHEAEIAQAESLSDGKEFVRIWMHAGFLFVNGKKMSKSLRNFITIDDFLRENTPELFRWIVLNHHYRSPIDYTSELVEQSRASLATMHQFVEKLSAVGGSAFGGKMAVKNHKGVKQPLSLEMRKRLMEAQNALYKAMDDDFNTPAALATIFDVSNAFQEKIWQLKPADAKLLHAYIVSALLTFGFKLKSPKIPREVATLVKKREALRSSQQFIQSDALRKEVDALGFIIEDTPLGPFLWPKTDPKYPN